MKWNGFIILALLPEQLGARVKLQDPADDIIYW